MSNEDEVWQYRPRSSGISTGAAWAFTAMAGLTLALDGGAVALLGALPLLVLAALGAWLVFWYPRVIVGPGGIELINPARTFDVPWEALIDVTAQYTFAAVTPHGRYRAWAAPGPGRHATLQATEADLRAVVRDGSRAVSMGELPLAPSGVVTAMVRRRWVALVRAEAIDLGVADSTPVSTRWNWPWLAVVGILLAVSVAIVAI